jgi:Uncharacterised nucleotidyltransferase
MANDEEWAPLRPPRAGPRRVRALIDLCRCLSAHLRGDPVPEPARWDEVVATAEYFSLTPALWQAVRQMNGIEADVASRLRAEYAANVVTLSQMSSQLSACIGALNGDGIEPVVLKGALGLLERGDGPPLVRVMSDVDLLVADEDIDVTLGALGQMGYGILPGPGAAHRFEWTARHPDLRFDVDLHRALGTGPMERVLPVSAVLQGASRRQVDGLRYRVMSDADQLAHAVIHSQWTDKAHRTGSIPLRQLHNFAVLYDQINDPSAWSAAVHRLTDAGLGSVVNGHAALERYLFALDLPEPDESLGGRAHLARCLVTHAIPHLADIQTNLLLTFETPTMADRYPASTSQSARIRHALRLLKKGVGSIRSDVLETRNR